MRKQDKMQEAERSFIREVLEFVRLFAVMFIIMYAMMHYVVVNATIPSESMENTLEIGDRLFANRLAYLQDDPERFDIIIFKYPDNEKKLYIKRIIGLPGEKVEIKSGKVYINDSETPLDDSFCKEEPRVEDFGPYQVPEDSYFVLGDNRNRSEDSRYWVNTFVKREKIVGKAGLRYFPLNKIGFVD